MSAEDGGARIRRPTAGGRELPCLPAQGPAYARRSTDGCSPCAGSCSAACHRASALAAGLSPLRSRRSPCRCGRRRRRAASWIASAAPEASPSRMPRSSSGGWPRRSSSRAMARLGRAMADPAMRDASRARAPAGRPRRAVATKPSSSTGTRRRRAARTAPSIAASSRPPTWRRTSSGSLEAAPMRASALVDHLGLARDARAIEPGAGPGPDGRRCRRGAQPRWPPRRWCCRSPSRRSPAGRAVRHRREPDADRLAGSSASLIAGRGEVARRPAVRARHHAQLGARRARASWLIAAPPAAKFATICAGDLGRDRPRRRAGRSRASRRRPGSARARAAADAGPASRPASADLLQPAERAGRLGQLRLRASEPPPSASASAPATRRAGCAKLGKLERGRRVMARACLGRVPVGL